MSIEIKSWRDGKVLYTADNAQDVRQAVQEAVREGANLGSANLGYADLRSANLGYANLRSANLGYADLRSANLGSANLRSADLRSADLRSANLGYADLRSANLRSADLRSANLGSANLRSADLRSANLGYAKGLAPERVNDLLLLLDQPGKIRAYKLVTADLKSPIHSSNRITYEIGSTVEVEANPDPNEQCGAGINLATLPWCLKNWQPGYRVLLMEFTKKDIAAIPVGDGKFRVDRAKVVREIPEEQVHEWLGVGQEREATDV